MRPGRIHPSQPQCLPSARFDLGGGFVDLLLAARRGDDIGPGIGEAKAQGAPDSRGPSSYNRDLAFKA